MRGADARRQCAAPMRDAVASAGDSLL